MNSSAVENLPKERIIENTRSAILKWSKTHFSRFLEQSAEKLFNLANKSDSNESQNRYFQARDQLINQRFSIEQAFSAHTEEAFVKYKLNQLTNTDISIEDENEEPLSLIDNDKLEESLAIKTMTLKASADCSDGVYALNQRLAALRGGLKMTDYGNPIAPGVFAEALQNGFTKLLLDNQSRLIIFKMFDSMFMRKLNSLYNLLNQHFESKGLLPHLNYEAKKSPSDLLPEELKELENQGSMEHQVELFQAIQKLQQHIHGMLPRPMIPAGQAINVQQLVQSIQQLQHNAAGEVAAIENQLQTADFNPQPLRDLAEAEAKKSNDVDTHVIEIVGLLFEYMLNDEKLPDSVKTLLSYLHTPFLKVAVIDKEFFNHPQHPARQLLNNLVASGERWVEPNSKHKNEVFMQIKAVVERILNDFDNDIRLFSELAFEFNRHLRQHSRRIRLTEERSMQAAQGENKLKEIRLKVEAYIKKKIGPVNLPAFATTLLYQPWANFLSFNLLRFGSRSGQWQHASSIVDDILWYIQIIQYSTQPQKNPRFLELLESLPKALQEGFETVGYDTNQAQQLLDALMNLQPDTKEQEIASLPEAGKQPETHEENEPDDVPDDSKEPELINAHIDEMDISKDIQSETQGDDVVQTLKQTEFGTWFLFNADQPKLSHQVKLAWSNTKTLHFMFVNRLGQQIAVKTGQELAESIRAGEVKILSKEEDKPFFEKALERVLKQIQHKGTAEK